MKKIIATMSVLASFSMVGLAIADQAGQKSAMGTIKSLDAANRMITLDDGSTYRAGEKANFDALKQGGMVRLSCDQKSDGMANCSVSSAAKGKIKVSDPVARTITLEDSTLYTVPSDMDLNRFKTGSDVDVGFEEMDGKRSASSLTLAGEGTIQSVNPDAKTLTFADGTEFTAGEGVALDTLKPGSNVRVSYDDVGGKKMITGVQMRSGTSQ